jgi:hypothetical protein
VVVGIVMVATTYLQRRSIRGLDLLAFISYIVVGLLWFAGLLIDRRRSYVETAERGFMVSRLSGRELIAYESIRWARVQSLENHFQAPERRRLIRPLHRVLLPKPAVFIRLQGDAAELERVGRKLGRTLVDGDLLAVPVPDPDGIAEDLSRHMPERAAVNLGGQRRGRRRRR